MIPVPLLIHDPDVSIDLAGVFNIAYNRSRYARSLHHNAPVSIPLCPDDRACAEAVARAAIRCE